MKVSAQPFVAPCSSASVVSRAVSFVGAAWRAATPKHFLYTFVLALAWSSLEFAPKPAYVWQHLPPVMNGTLSMQFNAFAVMLAILVADRASPPSARRVWPYLVAVIVGVTVGSSLMWLVSQRIVGIPTHYMLNRSYEGFDTFFYRHATYSLVACGLVAFIYVSRRWAVQRLAALRSVQLERAETEKRVLESRLSAMQARVEPEFLRETLAQVERLYESDAQAADRLLKELIVYLRAAIPQTSDPVSTLGREIGLTNAYLNIVGSTSYDRLVRSEGGTFLADDARMPPMVLLPLVNHALEHRSQARRDESFAIDVAASGRNLVLTVRDPGIGFSPTWAGHAAIRHVRIRLASLYGESARLMLNEEGDGTTAIITLPLEGAPDSIPV